MSIRFYCLCCGARFRVPTRQAGRKGRCYRCGHPSHVPDPEQLAAYQPWVRRRRRRGGVAGATEPTPGERTPAEGSTTLSAWLKAATLSVGLEALSLDRIPVDPKGRGGSAFDFDADSKPYPVAVVGAVLPPSGSRPAGAMVRLWRREMNVARRIFRWLHEGAFLASVPFLLVMFYGIVAGARGVALFGAAFAVALNVGRAIAGTFGLATLVLLDGFRLGAMRKPLQRVLEPLLTIEAIVLLFTFIPWLSSPGRPPAGTLVERLEGEARGIGDEMTGVLGKAIDKAAGRATPVPVDGPVGEDREEDSASDR